MTPDKLVQIATENNEPEWFIQKRRMALDVMDELPLPEIQRFDFHNWQMTPDVSERIRTSLPSKLYI